MDTHQLGPGVPTGETATELSDDCGLGILDQPESDEAPTKAAESPDRGRRRPRRRRSRLRRVLLGLTVCLVVLVAIPSTVLLVVTVRLDHHLHRIDNVFTGLTDRPPRAAGAAGHAVNILVLGTDRRSDVPTTGGDAKAPAWVPGLQRSDTIMLVHIDAERRGAEVVSIPRDSWVPIPGHGMNKINAAFSFGGPSLAVATVEGLTGVRIDHLAVVDWNGFKALTDGVGGVDVDIPQTVHDSARDITWTAGRHHLDGAEALNYVGQRYGLPGGDLDRVKRQQAFLRALMQTSLHQEMRKNPKLLYDFLDTVSRHLSVDSGWSMRSMAQLVVSLRNLRSADIYYMTAPVAGTGREGEQSIVRLAPRADAELWSALHDDTMDEWESIHWSDLTGSTVN